MPVVWIIITLVIVGLLSPTTRREAWQTIASLKKFIPERKRVQAQGEEEENDDAIIASLVRAGEIDKAVAMANGDGPPLVRQSESTAPTGDSQDGDNKEPS